MVAQGIEVDGQQRRVRVVLSEVITLDDLRGYVDELVQRGYWQWPTVIDTSAALGLDLDGGGAIAFAEHVVARASGARPRRHGGHHARGSALGASLIAASQLAFPDRPERRRVMDSMEAAHAWLDSQPPAPTAADGE